MVGRWVSDKFLSLGIARRSTARRLTQPREQVPSSLADYASALKPSAPFRSPEEAVRETSALVERECAGRRVAQIRPFAGGQHFHRREFGMRSAV